MVESPCISSFVIRIVEEKNPQFSTSPYRGFVRHVQSGEELSFTSWSGAEEFIQRFVPIHLMEQPLDGSNLSQDGDQNQGTS